MEEHVEENFSQRNEWINLNATQKQLLIDRCCPYNPDQIMNFRVECLFPFRGKIISDDEKCDTSIDCFENMQRLIEESREAGDYDSFRMEDELSTALSIAPQDPKEETFLPSFIPLGAELKQPTAPRPSNDKMAKSIPKVAIDYLLPISVTAEKNNCLKAK